MNMQGLVIVDGEVVEVEVEEAKGTPRRRPNPFLIVSLSSCYHTSRNLDMIPHKDADALWRRSGY